MIGAGLINTSFSISFGLSEKLNYSKAEVTVGSSYFFVGNQYRVFFMRTNFYHR